MPGRKGIFYGWWVVLAGLLLITITVPFTSALVSLYMIPITKEFHIPRSAFTLTTTVIAACGILLSPVVGKMVQKYNVKLILSISISVFALSYMSYGLAQSVYHLYISAAFLGLSFAFCGNLSTQIIIVNWFKKSRGLAMSIAISGIGLGGFILSPIIANLIMNYGWRQTYFIMGLVILIVGLPIALFIMKKTPEEIGLNPYGADEVDQSENPKAEIEVDITPAEAKKKPFFYIYLVGIFTIGLFTTGSLQQINPYVSDMHGMAYAATIVSIYSLLGIFGKLILGWLSDKLGIIKSGAIGYLAISISFILLLFGQHKSLLIIMALFFALGNAVASVSIPLFASHIFGTNNSGVMMGITNSAFQVGMALGGVITGAVYDVMGSYTWAWIGLTVTALLSMVCILLSYSISRKKYSSDVKSVA
ncbi:MFS transporter [Bacillus sp. EB600]|uniref:MFS transporter n=1 Tax=Bacillus sp. EB600 TaxID=2806345 RepID=UPI002109243D|nr:MFS transporter [Bacillus sp. EB600]MCQ6280258.1 MFS transporter [Bacillus sp. EB600]